MRLESSELTFEFISTKLSDVLSKNGGAVSEKETLLVSLEFGRVFLSPQNCSALCLSLEYDRGRRLNSRPVMRYYQGWELVEGSDGIVQTWLEQVREIAAIFKPQKI